MRRRQASHPLLGSESHGQGVDLTLDGFQLPQGLLKGFQARTLLFGSIDALNGSNHVSYGHLRMDLLHICHIAWAIGSSMLPSRLSTILIQSLYCHPGRLQP